VLALFLERGHSRMRPAKLLGDLKGPQRRQRREVRLKLQQVRAPSSDLRHPGRATALNPDQAAILQGAR
jgi:hypothetical protein